MATSAVIEGCKDAGLAPGEGIRDALDGPDNLQLFDELDGDAERVSGQLLGHAPVSRGGRKPGAKNRATREIIEWVRTRYTDPLMWMGEIASMSLEELVEWGGFRATQSGSASMHAAEFQRKVVGELKNTLYPGSTIADMLKATLGDDGVLQVVGFMAMAAAKRGDLGAAAPDIEGGKAEAETLARRPVEDKQNQAVSGGEDA